jgi:hypothetical protein
MKVIRLRASDWKAPDDFYSALLPELGAPSWHGRNLDAFAESLAALDINAVRPPFVVEVSGSAALPPEMRAFLAKVADVFEYARCESERDIALILD